MTAAEGQHLPRVDQLGVARAAGTQGCGAESRDQFARTAHKIRMDVRFQDVCNRHSKLPRGLQVSFRVWSRIDHRSGGRTVVADQVRKLRYSWRFEPLENHRHGVGPCLC